MSKIPLCAPFIEKDEVLAIQRVLESGNLVQGEQVEAFERELAEYIGCKHVVCVTSATTALDLALIMAGVGPNDEVIMPAFTFPSVAMAIVLRGAKPVFADVEYNSYNINPKEVEASITEHTKAIIPTAAFGLPYDMEAIRAIADKHKLIVIGDDAGALGSKYWGKRLGATECDLYNPNGTPKKDEKDHIIRGLAEDMTIFSFHATKTLTTGEGGCIATNNSEWATQMRILRDHGSIKRDEPEYKSRFVTLGFNYRMTDLQAALGRVQLIKLEEMIQQRRKLATTYTELLENLNTVTSISQIQTREGTIPIPEKRYNIVTPYETEGYWHSYQRYVIYLTFHDGIIVRNELRKRGIGVTFGYYNVPDEPFAEKLQIYKRCPIARNCYRHTVALPLYHTISREQQEEVVNTLKEILKL